jgi:signal recognition particle receptor subunit beta
MVFFNYATMQMAAKIVYYGPGLCGKTTNLHQIYSKTSPQSRGEMVSLETETDRTLFFDLLPIDVGVIGGFKTRLQLYTIPGQVFYNTTRKLVLKGVDGIVFVADSQLAMLDANVESFKNLRDNLAEIGLSVDEIPLVLQLNKRDLPSIASVDTLLDTLDADRKYEWVEAVASTGNGVFETLKTISKATLRTLRRRMTGAEEPAARAPKRDTGAFKVRTEEPAAAAPPSRTASGSTPVPPPAAPTPPPAQTFATTKMPAFNPQAAPAARPAPPPQATARPNTAPVPAMKPAPAPQPQSQPQSVSAPVAEPEIVDTVGAADKVFADSTLARTADVDKHIISSAPVADAPATLSAEAIEAESAPAPTQYIPPPAPAPQPPPAAPPPPPPEPVAAQPKAAEPEIDFSRNEKPAKPAEVKHVKVRSSVDIMAELESLRKKATASPKPAPKKEAPALVMPEIIVPRPPRDLNRTLALHAAPNVLPRTRSLRVTVSFESGSGTLQTQEHSIELGDASDVSTVSVNLKIDQA